MFLFWDRTQVVIFVAFGLWSTNQEPCETLKQYDSKGIQIISILIGEGIITSENVEMLTCFDASQQNEMYYFETLEEATVQFDSIFTSSIDICNDASPYDGSYYRMKSPDIYGYPMYKLDSSDYDYQISLEGMFEKEIVATWGSSHWNWTFTGQHFASICKKEGNIWFHGKNILWKKISI